MKKIISQIIAYFLNKNDCWYKWAYLTCSLVAAILAVGYYHYYKGVSIWYANQWFLVWIADSVLSLVLVIPVYRDIAKANREKEGILSDALTTPQGREALARSFITPKKEEELVGTK